MAAHDPTLHTSTGGQVTVTGWTACYNKNDQIIALYCTVTTEDSSASITGVGLILNNSEGMTLASTYTEFSGGVESASPSLNLPPGSLAEGDTVHGVVSGEVHKQHYFFEEKLTIGTCE